MHRVDNACISYLSQACYVLERTSIQAIRGRVLRCQATAASSIWVKPETSIRLGKYWLSKPLVFSLMPRCQGLCWSARRAVRAEAFHVPDRRSGTSAAKR